MDFSKSFTVVDAAELTAESVEALRPQEVNACWKPLWSAVDNDFKDFSIFDGEVRKILQDAKKVGRKGFDCMIEEQREALTNKELE